jgi:C4-dicarboxylate-specific signal transduction histidine kinase
LFTGFIRDLTAKEQDELRLKELQAELVHVSRLSAMGTMASTLRTNSTSRLPRSRSISRRSATCSTSGTTNPSCRYGR